jgi:hypothetical protein
VTSPISAEARRYVRARATEVMEYTCQIYRGSTPEGYDESTLVYTAGGLADLIYEGPCRIWEVAGASAVVLGDTEVYQQPTQMSIPWDESVIIRRYDEVLITEAPEDSQMVGERFEIQSIAKGGELRATRKFQVVSVMV